MENSTGDDLSQLLRELFPHTGRSFVIGVTGSPGTGKSTLVDQLARHYADSGSKVGIVAVDPTSPFSGGAILGDRVRMQSLFTDPKIFIRSMATRGKMGGLSTAVNDALLVLDAAGYEILMVETVGVGQDEVEIVKTAHMTLVVLVPGMGDDIQAIKAGIMEIGDIYVVNKADRPGVSEAERELEELLSMTTPRRDGWSPPIVKTVATRGEGVFELAGAIDKYRSLLSEPGGDGARTVPLLRERLVEMLQHRLSRTVLQRISAEKLDQYAEKMMTRELDPYTIVDRLLKDLGLGEESYD
ncbi:methylmalonyl Co-A mutase-associated GTPase MeaB [Acidobacteria bacterium AH-259-D05]|nr:methylmalonyl Co-A mutase-associated GTPase MeaB [Acidobacteria bacterium AH-259-D05]